MEEKKIDITWKLKTAAAKKKAEELWRRTKEFVSDNKEWVLAVGVPTAVAAVGGVCRHISKQHNNNETRRLKDNYIYDNRHGMYFETKRKMTTNERLEYARRRDEGEGVESILRDMRILK